MPVAGLYIGASILTGVVDVPVEPAYAQPAVRHMFELPDHICKKAIPHVHRVNIVTRDTG